jgi:hypothetical protein
MADTSQTHTTTAPIARIVGWYDSGAAAIIEIVVDDKTTHQVLDPLGTPEISGQSLSAARKAAVALWGEFCGTVYEQTLDEEIDIEFEPALEVATEASNDASDDADGKKKKKKKK